MDIHKSFERFARHNLHWISSNKYKTRDPHLSKLATLKRQFSFQFVEDFPLEAPGIYILTGGRQLGKSTCLKQILHKSLELTEDPERSLYLPCDTIFDRAELYKLLKVFLEAQENKPTYLFIDEISYLENWELSIKALADENLLSNCSLLISGSDKILIEDAISKLPGRRGQSDKKDFHLRPLTFKEFTRLFPEVNFKNKDNLIKFFNNFLNSGGYPVAINDLDLYGKIHEATFDIYQNWIIGDFLNLKKSKKNLLQVLLALVKTYGSQISYQALSDHTDGLSRDSVRDYCAILERLDVLYVQHAIDINKLRAAPKKDKKFHFYDPFITQAIIRLINNEYLSEYQINESHLVESAAVNHYQRFFPTYYFKGTGEIDIIYLDQQKIYPVEIKWRNQIRSKDLKQLSKLENGLVLTKNFDQEEINNIPTESLIDKLYKME